MAEQRKGKKIRKWDEVNGAEEVEVSEQIPDGQSANPIRSLEDQLEQNDNQLDGIINNLPKETPAEEEQRTSIVEKLKVLNAEQEKKPLVFCCEEIART